MKVDDIIDKIKKSLGSVLSLRNVLIFIGVGGLGVLIFLSYMSYQSVSSFESVMRVIQTQNQSLMKNWEEEKNKRDKIIKDLQRQLKAVEKKETELRSKLKKERDEYAKIKEPKTRQETIDRLNKLGYNAK